MTAIGRELLGFIWAIAVRTEAKFQTEPKGRLASSMPAIPSTSIVLHPRHPSRLPFGSRQLAGAHCRSVLTGPDAGAKNPLAEKREWQALSWQTFSSMLQRMEGQQW